MNSSRKSGSDMEYIVPLYRLAISNSSVEKMADWLAMNGLRHSNQMVKRTLKLAGREDLIRYLIKEEDVSVGDSIKSRLTARTGTVTGVKPDGDTIEVIWDAGGKQLLSKESVFKLRTKEMADQQDFSKLHTHTDDNYQEFNKQKTPVAATGLGMDVKPKK